MSYNYEAENLSKHTYAFGIGKSVNRPNSPNEIHSQYLRPPVSTVPDVSVPSESSVAMPGIQFYPGNSSGFYIVVNPFSSQISGNFARMQGLENTGLCSNLSKDPPLYCNVRQNSGSIPFPSGNSPDSTSIMNGLKFSGTRLMRVYCLGSLGYDFLTDSKRDTFRQLLGKTKHLDSCRDMAEFFLGRPVRDTKTGLISYDTEWRGNYEWAEELTWTINQDKHPLYVIRPIGAGSGDFYRILPKILYWSLNPEDRFIDRNITAGHMVKWVGVAGEIVGEEKLYNGEVVPVVSCRLCGLNAWMVDDMVNKLTMALSRVKDVVVDREKIFAKVDFMLGKIYRELLNPGVGDDERAMNYAATNMFLAAGHFADLFKNADVSYELGKVEISNSCMRPSSDGLKDVKLMFFDSGNREGAKKCYRLTVDLSGVYPVLVGGTLQTWSEY